MDSNINLNDKLKSLSLLEIVICLIAVCVLSILLDSFLVKLGIDSKKFSMLLPLFLVLLFLFRGVSDLKPSLSEIFIKENRNESLYLLVINLLFGFFILGLFGSFDSTFSKGLISPSSTGLILIFEVISTVIFAPVVEELIFRGIILNKLNSRMSFIYAMIISSILFSLFHGLGRLLTTFLFGLTLCIIYLKTDNILIPIFIHVMNNLIATILTDFGHIEPIVANPPVSYITLIISTIAGMLIIYIYKNTKALKANNST